MSANSARIRSGFWVRATPLGSTSGPKFWANSRCCSGVSVCSGKISTAYCQNAALTASRSSGGSGRDRSTSPTSATNSGVTG